MATETMAKKSLNQRTYDEIAWLQLICTICDHLWVLDANDALKGDANTNIYQLCKQLQSSTRPEELHTHHHQQLQDTCSKVRTCHRKLMAVPEINIFRPSEPQLFFTEALGIALSVPVEYSHVADDNLHIHTMQDLDREWMKIPAPVA
jgi:hypothetical protein